MSTQRWLIAVAIVVIALAAWFATRRAAVTNDVALLDRLAEAEKRTNVEQSDQFTLGQVTIDGTARHTILARPHSRLIWPLVVPPDAWFEVSFALKPEVWEGPGDGAQFRVGVSDGRNYDELLRQHVDPRRGDRRWFVARLDLSAYEGRDVKLILNTDPGPPGSADTDNDLAVWADPRIYSRR